MRRQFGHESTGFVGGRPESQVVYSRTQRERNMGEEAEEAEEEEEVEVVVV